MQSNIRKAFEKRLITMPEGLGSAKTAFENVPFTPIEGEPYQMSKLVPVEAENPTLGDDYHREVGFYQVVLSYPKGKGVGAITTMADKIKSYFKRGTTLTEGTDKVIVEATPSVSSVYITDTRAELVVRIRYYCEQFTS